MQSGTVLGQIQPIQRPQKFGHKYSTTIGSKQSFSLQSGIPSTQSSLMIPLAGFSWHVSQYSGQ